MLKFDALDSSKNCDTFTNQLECVFYSFTFLFFDWLNIYRFSAISNSSTDSCESDGSPAVKCSSNTAALSAAKSCPHVVDIERADSGVGSESSKSSKASVELRRAASLSKNSDSGSSSSGNQTERPSPAPSTPPMPTPEAPKVGGQRNPYGEQTCEDCDLELPPPSPEENPDPAPTNCDM